MTSDDSLGRFISLVLRHKPEAVGIQLDEHGWAEVDALIQGMNRVGRKIDNETLERIVRENNKKRYSYNEDHTKIRANQGHSIQVDVQLKEAIPPEKLYHGTATHFLEHIEKEGIQKRSRQYVHLSSNKEIAVDVGKRHGKPVVLVIDAKRMHQDGIKFYCSENKVWLCNEVQWKYIMDVYRP